MRFGKKGQEGLSEGQIVGLFLLLVGVITLGVFWGQASVMANGMMDGGICGMSSALASFKTEFICTDIESPTALMCPRKNIEIGTEKTLLSFKGETATISVDQSNKEEIEKLFADELMNCWKKFGSGEIALFPEKETRFFSLNKKEATACHICSEIHFSQGVNLPETDIFTYMKETTYEGDKTYIEILNNPKMFCQSDFKTDNPGCWTSFEEKITQDKRPFFIPAGSPRTERGLRETNAMKTIPRITTLEEDTTYAVIMMRRGFDLCDDDDAPRDDAELTTFAYIIPQDQLDVCETIIT